MSESPSTELATAKPIYLDFDWAIYAHATSAGLATLIPLPLLDWLAEEFFRRRMPKTIATRRQQTLNPMVIGELNYRESNYLRTCLLLPFILTIILIKRISKKILYFLTIKEAADKVSHYWHQAFLLDYMLAQGHLNDETSTRLARLAMEQVLETVTTSPLTKLAQEVIAGTRHVGRTLFKFRRGREDEVMHQTQSDMARSWADYEGYFKAVTALYDQSYRNIAQAEAAKAHEI